MAIEFSVSQARFIYNGGYQNFYQEITSELQNCDEFAMSVAFIRFSGLQLLLDVLKELEKKDVKGRILTSTYLNSTEPKALEALGRFTNIQTRIFVPSRDRGFHSKGYLFRKSDQHRVIIGSSNITQSALKSNVEWNVFNQQRSSDPFIKDVLHEFENQWGDERTKELSLVFLAEYRDYLSRLSKKLAGEETFEFDAARILPNRMQLEAMTKLERLRSHHESKALAIAATGSGKTYMAVFDSLQVRPARLLFVAHREDILIKAQQSFSNIIDTNHVTTGLFTGNHKDEADYLFCTVQTLQHHLADFAPNAFDYIIIDEAHHATSPGYRKILDYFKPSFLLGLTATPERTDDGDIYSLFDNNVAVEIRLRQALEWELVIPFHYFGITDISGIDYTNVDSEDIAAVAKLLMVGRRVDFVIEKMLHYGFDGEKRQALGFCATIEHSEFMAKEFNDRGIESISLSGAHNAEERTEAIARLASHGDSLQVIFSVDVFNEGIDIPSVNTILMLRPTESAIIFVQQLGRGLRKSDGKEFVTVLDFIGNHRKSFLMAIALMGGRHFDKDDLKVSVNSSFADIPGSTHINMDQIAKEQILAQLDAENFSSMKYLREEYFDFKTQFGGTIPRMLDYLKVDGAVDPLKFAKYAQTYLQFAAKVEQSESLTILLGNGSFQKILQFFSNLLPCKRIHDLVIANYLLSHNTISPSQASSEIAKYQEDPLMNTVMHAFTYLSQVHFDKGERKNFAGLLC